MSRKSRRYKLAALSAATMHWSYSPDMNVGSARLAMRRTGTVLSTRYKENCRVGVIQMRRIRGCRYV